MWTLKHTTTDRCSLAFDTVDLARCRLHAVIRAIPVSSWPGEMVPAVVAGSKQAKIFRLDRREDLLQANLIQPVHPLEQAAKQRPIIV